MHFEEIDWVLILRICGAALLAGLIGIERESKSKPAGFRTHMLVGAAAALLVALGPSVVAEFGLRGVPDSVMRADPLRIVEAIIVGISFIGAGTILKVPGEHRIEFLTTAAGILLSAGVGIAMAVGEYLIAVAVVILTLIVTFTLHRVDRWLR